MLLDLEKTHIQNRIDLSHLHSQLFAEENPQKVKYAVMGFALHASFFTVF